MTLNILIATSKFKDGIDYFGSILTDPYQLH